MAVLALAVAQAAGEDRVVESVVPALLAGGSCQSAVSLQNLGDRAVTVEAEAHRTSGALAPWSGRAGNSLRLNAGARVTLQLDSEEETSDAWVRIREHIPAPAREPVVAVSGATECVSGNELRKAPREVAYPSRNPWFSGDVGELPGELLMLINASEHPARAEVCYSAGGLYSVPGETRKGELRPICTSSFDVQVPPFGSRHFPVEREGNTHFSLKTEGERVVLEMLKPLDGAAKLYVVNSTIRFGAEVPPAR